MAQAIAALTGGWVKIMMLRLPSMRATPGTYSWTIRSTFKWNMRLFFFSHQLLPLILLSLMAIYFNLWWGLRDVCDAVFASIYILSWEAKVCVRMNEWENGKSIRRRSLLAFGLSLSRPFSRNDWGCCWSVWSSWLCEEGQQCSILLQ